MNVNPFSYLIEKLKSKVSKSGDTMTGILNIEANNSIPLYIKRTGSTGSVYSAYENANGILGFYGVGNDKKPYFFPEGGTNTQIALTSDIATIITLTQTDFFWDSGNKYFVSNNTVSQIVGSKTIENIGGYFTNGAAIWGYRINSNGKINVMGWIPSSGQYIDSAYQFTMNIFAR